MHKVESERLLCIAHDRIRHRIILVVEDQAPWCLLALFLKTYSSVELHTDWQVPFKGFSVELEPHLFVVVDCVLWGVLVKECFDIHQDVIEIVLTRGHDLKTHSCHQHILQSNNLHRDF